jgi:Helix-turn-helix domain
MTKKRLTTPEVAKRLGVCQQRVMTKVRQGHFPNHEWCECGRSIMIPEEDVTNPKPILDKRRKTKNA